MNWEDFFMSHGERCVSRRDVEVTFDELYNLFKARYDAEMEAKFALERVRQREDFQKCYDKFNK